MIDESASARVPIEVRTVAFYGDEITGALVRIGNETTIYVPIRPICDYLGLDWSAQRQRMQRDEVLQEGVVVITIPSEGGPPRLWRVVPALQHQQLQALASQPVRPGVGLTTGVVG